MFVVSDVRCANKQRMSWLGAAGGLYVQHQVTRKGLITSVEELTQTELVSAHTLPDV